MFLCDLFFYFSGKQVQHFLPKESREPQCFKRVSAFPYAYASTEIIRLYEPLCSVLSHSYITVWDSGVIQRTVLQARPRCATTHVHVLH